MTEDQIALARRAIACNGWRWMPGMRWVALRPAPLEAVSGRVPDDLRGWSLYLGALPDFSDAATLGCLLALVREAWGDPAMACVPTRDGWVVCAPPWSNQHPVARAATESKALVDALEAAP